MYESVFIYNHLVRILFHSGGQLRDSDYPSSRVYRACETQ
jgi:hypothetical protein